jgi:ABC-type lipoprotein release transport system permease subunit
VVLDRFRVISRLASLLSGGRGMGDVFFIDRVPFSVEAADVAAVLGVTLALALSAALYASRGATALSPIEAMRR